MAYTTIDDPSKHFQTVMYVGNQSTNAITFNGYSDLDADLVWIKQAGNATNSDDLEAPYLFDSTRGPLNVLSLNTTDVATDVSGSLTSFDSDGFTLGAWHRPNKSGKNILGMAWHANGGTTSTNTDGAVSSTLQVNTEAGFSIAECTMGSSNESVGHGLSQAPNIQLGKAVNRDDSNGGWILYTDKIDGSWDYFGNLNSAPVKSNSALSAPTSTTWIEGGSGTVAYRDKIVYLWHEVKGFSKFGTYEGNQFGHGPTIITGFAPELVIIFNVNTSHYFTWHAYSTGEATAGGVITGAPGNPNSAAFRNTTNPVNPAYGEIDMYSNGFRIITTESEENTREATYFYMAFAAHPWVTSTGVPCTAR